MYLIEYNENIRIINSVKHSNGMSVHLNSFCLTCVMKGLYFVAISFSEYHKIKIRAHVELFARYFKYYDNMVSNFPI